MKISEIMLIAASTALAGAALAEPVGNVGAVNQSAEGGGRKLSIGAGVEGGERITTDAKGSAQIVFRDKSTMTIGHASSVTINKFVFNANQGVGEQSAKLTKGALRFIGGAVSHSEGAKIETPSGSLTIRGGMAYACLDCPEGRIFAALTGEVTLSNGTSTVIIPRGEMVTEADGKISDPSRISPELLLALDKRFASAGGQRGGAKNPPTENDANTQLGDARMEDRVPWPGLDYVDVFPFGNTIVRSKAQSDNQQSANTVRVVTTPPPPPPQTESFSLIPPTLPP